MPKKKHFSLNLKKGSGKGKTVQGRRKNSA